MKLCSKTLVLVVIAMLSSTCAYASLVNFGFEDNSFNGWTSNGGTHNVVTNYLSGASTTYLPQEGNYFAQLGTGLGTGVYTTISQSFNANAGDVISGWAAFDTGDYLPYSDNAYVNIYSATGFGNTLWSKSISNVGSYGESPWQQWQMTISQAGTYTLQYGVANGGDNSADSWALFDAAQISPSSPVIPEPATMSLLSLGVFTLLGLRKRL